MQIHNFFSDPVPSVRNPLDSIVLSPHSINANDFGLADFAEDPNDYQSVLPSLCSCAYHDQAACKGTNTISKSIWDKCRDLFSDFIHY